MYREASVFFFNTSFFLMFPLFQKDLNPQLRTSKLVNSVVYHPWPSILALGYILISLNSLGFYLCPECFLNFLWLVEKSFQFMVFAVGNPLNLWIFTHVLVLHSKLQEEFCEICFPQGPRTKGWRKLWFALLKFSQKIWRWIGILVYLYLVWFIVLVNMMVLLFCE